MQYVKKRLRARQLLVIFNKEKLFLNNSCDPKNNFFNMLDFTSTTYFTPETLKAMIKQNNGISFSGIHRNIRSLNKSLRA